MVLSAFFADFLAKLFGPLIEKLAALVVQKIQEIQKTNEDERIEKFKQSMAQAKTDEERIKAAREAAEALRHL